MSFGTGPVTDAVAVSPSDTVDLATVPTRGLWIGAGGDVAVNMQGTGTAVVFKGAATGAILPIQVKRVLVTNTTASSIVALY